MADFLQTVRERVVIYDGAMGTSIQKRNPTLDDYWGKENCSEVLVLSRPDIIRDIHADFLRAGCDVVETNTFGATRIVLGEFGLQDRVTEINHAAVKLAKEAAQQFSTPDKPRFVAGSMGPTTKLPSLGHIGFDQMLEAYLEQALALIEAGVDVLLVETCQDLLQAKIGAIASLEAMQKAGLLTINAWAIDGFTKVFWRDEPVTHLWPQAAVLLVTATTLFLIARRLSRRWEYA